MAPPAYLLVLMSFAYGLGLTYAGRYFWRIEKQQNCEFQGYAPDGYQHTISSITPIQVEAPANALAKIAGIGATGNI